MTEKNQLGQLCAGAFAASGGPWMLQQDTYKAIGMAVCVVQKDDDRER